jgi:ABC-type antimicrobial peptide transport system permease subunit
MSTVGFAFKDLRRRKFQTVLTVVALSSCVVAMVSTVIIANNLDLTVPLIVAGKLSGSFINVFSEFATLMAFLSILAGAVMAYFFVSANMSERTLDIGITKAIGCLTEQVFGYFATQLSLIVLTSCIIGTCGGIFLSYFFIALNIASFPASNVFLNLWAIFIVLIVFAAVTHFFGIMPVVKAIEVSPSDALFPYYLRGVSFKYAKSPITKLGFSFKVAYRAFLRRKKATFSTIICLSVVLSTATVATAGTAIANQTSESYFRRGVGENVIIIGHPRIVAQYLSFLNRSFQTEGKATLNYLDSKYTISGLTISKLSNITGVVKSDARIFLETTVFERQTIFIVDKGYIAIGDRRSADALIFGLDSEQVVNDWLINGRTLNKTDQYSVLLGDSLTSKILSSPFDQKVTIQGKDFDIVGVVLDPLNLGFVAYLPIRTMSKLLNQTNHNLLLLKVDPTLRLPVLEKVKETLHGTELQFMELNPSIERYSGFLQSIWSSFTLLSIFFLATAALCLSSHITLRIAEQEPEFGIIRALGAKPKKAAEIIWIHAFLIILISGAVGIFIGLFVSFAFIIPEPSISANALLIIFAWLFLTLGFLCLTSLYPALKIARKPIARLISRW